MDRGSWGVGGVLVAEANACASHRLMANATHSLPGGGGDGLGGGDRSCSHFRECIPSVTAPRSRCLP